MEKKRNLLDYLHLAGPKKGHKDKKFDGKTDDMIYTAILHDIEHLMGKDHLDTHELLNISEDITHFLSNLS